MRRGILARGALAVTAVIAIAGGGALTFAESASAAGGTITVTPSSGLQPQGSTVVTVSGSGFANSSSGRHLGVQRLRHPCDQHSAADRRCRTRLGDAAPVSCGPAPRASGAIYHDERQRHCRGHFVHGDDGHGRPTGHRHRLHRRRRSDRRGQLPLPAHGGTASGRGVVCYRFRRSRPATKRQPPSPSRVPAPLRRTPPATTWPLRMAASSPSATCRSAARPEA